MAENNWAQNDMVYSVIIVTLKEKPQHALKSSQSTTSEGILWGRRNTTALLYMGHGVDRTAEVVQQMPLAIFSIVYLASASC